MAMIINTNIAALNAQRNLGTSQMSLQTSLQRLSSGLRINSAKDDAAGLAISSRMSSQINGLAQAARNANDGISMAQTAEGALSQISDNLQRMRDLSVQAANGSNSSSDRTAIQSEITQLQSEINRVSSQTAFNGTNLLDGTLSNAQFQVGANSNQTINAAIGSASATAIGSNTVTSGGALNGVGASWPGTAANAFNALGNGVLAQTINISGNGQTSPNIVIPPSSSADIGVGASSMHAVAAAINTASGTTGVTATATTTATLNLVSTGVVSLKLYGTPNGATGAANPITISASATSLTDVSGLTTAINAQAGSTGITAVANLTSGAITLTQSAGYDIGVINSGAALTAAVNLTGSTGGFQTLTPGTAANAGAVGGTVSLSSASSFSVTTTAAPNNIFTTAATSSALSSVAAINVTTLTGATPTGANSAISVIDAALNNINNSRAALGAMQNRFTSVVANLQTTQENLTASRSRIQDTDFAHETAQLTRGQILQQAGTAMLAQANSLPNGVLALLR